MRVTRVVLYRSELSGGGARYSEIAGFELVANLWDAPPVTGG
jgi:2'-5' RNA ligase